MINSEVNSSVLGNSVTGMPPGHKQSPLVKKIALRDVQNDNRTLIFNHPDSSPVLEGRPIADAVKVSGTKRLTPECPPLDPSLSKNGVNVLVHARRKFESEPDKGRIQDSTEKSAGCLQLGSKHSCQKQQELPRQQTPLWESNLYCAPVVRPNHTASMMTFPYGGPSFPISVAKPGNGLPAAESNCLKVNSEVYHSIDSKATDDQQRKERFLHLQKFLKQHDDSNSRDYIQLLLNFSPAELSRHAIDLEKRAIQLTMEEGKQMQRMKALNILGKSGPTNNPLLTTQQPNNPLLTTQQPQSKK